MSAVAAVTLALGLIGAPAWSAADGGHGEHEHPGTPAPAPAGTATVPAVAPTAAAPVPTPPSSPDEPAGGEPDMEGMSPEEMSEHDTDPEPEPGEHGEPATGHDEHAPDDAPAPERARSLVLGSFAGVNAAVLLGAGLLRRHDRAHARHPAPTAAGTRTGAGTGRPARTSPRPEADR
jgi:hypothetical protein